VQMTLWSFDTIQEFWSKVTLAICPFGLMTCSREHLRDDHLVFRCLFE
jgi:hypothetical protein